MKINTTPELTSLKVGDSIKVLQVKGTAGAKMAPHHSTKETVIVVEEGQAVLKMPKNEYTLKKGSIFIIPAGKEHTLIIQKELKALAIMAIDSEINFI